MQGWVGSCVCAQLCGCALVVLGVYLHADRQSSITARGQRTFRSASQSVVHLSRPAAVDPRLGTSRHHRAPGQGAGCHGNGVVTATVVMGMSVATLSFLGCCGACVDSACFLCLVSKLVIFTCRQCIWNSLPAQCINLIVHVYYQGWF